MTREGRHDNSSTHKLNCDTQTQEWGGSAVLLFCFQSWCCTLPGMFQLNSTTATTAGRLFVSCSNSLLCPGVGCYVSHTTRDNSSGEPLTTESNSVQHDTVRTEFCIASWRDVEPHPEARIQADCSRSKYNMYMYCRCTCCCWCIPCLLSCLSVFLQYVLQPIVHLHCLHFSFCEW